MRLERLDMAQSAALPALSAFPAPIPLREVNLTNGLITQNPLY